MKKTKFRIRKEISYKKGKRYENYTIEKSGYEYGYICCGGWLIPFIPIVIIFCLIANTFNIHPTIAILVAFILSILIIIPFGRDKAWEEATEDRFKKREDAIEAIKQIKNNTYDTIFIEGE